jgi:hypothetical protein
MKAQAIDEDSEEIQHLMRMAPEIIKFTNPHISAPKKKGPLM